MRRQHQRWKDTSWCCTSGPGWPITWRHPRESHSVQDARTAEDCKSNLGDLGKGSQTKHVPSMQLSHSSPPLVLSSLTARAHSEAPGFSSFLHRDHCCLQILTPPPPPRGAFQGPVGGKPAQHLVRPLKGVPLPGAGAMPKGTQWARDTMGFTDWECLGGQTRPGILWGSQDVGNVVPTAANTTLGRNGAVTMGTVKGGNAHDERLSGRLGRTQK